MRIIAGKVGGLKLKTLDGKNTRPTADRVKEALFSIINPLLQDAVVLDLFAGSGALGIEALSRGAKFSVFVDNHPKAVDIIKSNIEHTKQQSNSEVFLADYEKILKIICQNKQKYDIVFIDPPYGLGFEIKACELLIKYELLYHNSIVIIEHENINKLPDRISNLVTFDKRVYGRVGISFYEPKLLKEV